MYNGSNIAVLIAAAGSGTRMGGSVPKQYMNIDGRSVLSMTVEAFAKHEYVDSIYIISNPEHAKGQPESRALSIAADAAGDRFRGIVPGGSTRQESVYNALEHIAAADGLQAGKVHEAALPDIVLIHDGARPFVSGRVISDVVEQAARSGAAVAAVPVKDTIRREHETLDRSDLYAVQTPQGFRFADILDAYRQAHARGESATDDAGIAELAGYTVTIAAGDYANIKITTKEDLPMTFRTGIGYDVHRLTPERRLIIGGVEIAHTMGLDGHSDADVLTHAIMDAVLGAASLGDIGMHFPDTDDEYEGADSMDLLRRVGELVAARGYEVSNIDAVVAAQRPKLAPYIDAMRAGIAGALGIDARAVSVKATTTEGLGFEGRQEGISAQAVCTLRSGAV